MIGRSEVSANESESHNNAKFDSAQTFLRATHSGTLHEYPRRRVSARECGGIFDKSNTLATLRTCLQTIGGTRQTSISQHDIPMPNITMPITQTYDSVAASSSSAQPKPNISVKKGSRQPEVVQYWRHCGLNYEQAQGEETEVQK